LPKVPEARSIVVPPPAGISPTSPLKSETRVYFFATDFHECLLS
jgi:hypothetical protein